MCDYLFNIINPFMVGKNMPESLRETGIGGLAGTPTGQEIRMRIFGKNL